MARQKNTKETSVETQDVQKEIEIQEETSVEVQDVQKETELQQISEQISKLLKCYSNYSELYIDSKGGVYPKNTQQNLIKDAILYQNPYYKS